MKNPILDTAGWVDTRGIEEANVSESTGHRETH
jgi:hypothetical protein